MFERFWATICKTVRPMLLDRHRDPLPLSLPPFLSPCLLPSLLAARLLVAYPAIHWINLTTQQAQSTVQQSVLSVCDIGVLWTNSWMVQIKLGMRVGLRRSDLVTLC